MNKDIKNLYRSMLNSKLLLFKKTIDDYYIIFIYSLNKITNEKNFFTITNKKFYIIDAIIEKEEDIL